MQIAIIDSGVDISHPILNKCIIRGVGISIKENGKVEITDDYNDTTGHGTAIAGIIAKNNKNCITFCIVKITSNIHLTDERHLIEALKWCLLQDEIKIINISLGIETTSPSSELYSLCENAIHRNKVIIAASHNNINKECYPAYFHNVFAVTSGPVKSFEWGYIENSPIEFYAKGGTQRVAIINGKYNITSGTSYAAAHFTRIVASILIDNNNLDVVGLRSFLINDGLKDFIPTQLLLDQKNKHAFHQFDNTEKNDCQLFNEKLDWIGDLAIFPASEKEMSLTYKFRDLLIHKVNIYYDYPKSISIELLKGNRTENYKRTIEEADFELFNTAVIGYYLDHQFDANVRFGNEFILKCLQKKKNFIVWDEKVKKYIELISKKFDYMPKIKIPLIDDNILNNIYQFRHFEAIKIPVILVIGTSNKQGKYTTQLKVKQILSKEGYNVSHISTEPHGSLFGSVFDFPYGFNSTVKVNNCIWGLLLRSLVKGIQKYKKPDLIISGTQSKVIPRTLSSNELSNETLFNSLAFLAGMEADAYICAINPQDTIEFIKRFISNVEAFSSGKIILFIMTPWMRDFKNKTNENVVPRNYFLEEKEFEDKRKIIENNFGIPVIDIMNIANDKLVLDLIESFFSKDQTTISHEEALT